MPRHAPPHALHTPDSCALRSLRYFKISVSMKGDICSRKMDGLYSASAQEVRDSGYSTMCLPLCRVELSAWAMPRIRVPPCTPLGYSYYSRRPLR
jgi:hypothetical protein